MAIAFLEVVLPPPQDVPAFGLAGLLQLIEPFLAAGGRIDDLPAGGGAPTSNACALPFNSSTPTGTASSTIANGSSCWSSCAGSHPSRSEVLPQTVDYLRSMAPSSVEAVLQVRFDREPRGGPGAGFRLRPDRWAGTFVQMRWTTGPARGSVVGWFLRGRSAVARVTSEPDTDRRDAGFSPIVTLGALVGVTAATMAGATVWLVVTNPVGLIEALDGGEVSPIVLQIASALYDFIVRLLGYL